MPTRDAKNNILFIYHRLDGIGGIETRWIDEFKYLYKHNYQVYLLTNKSAFDPKVAVLFDRCHVLTVDITSVSLATDFIKLVDAIVDTIKTHDIHVLSIHMLDLFACAAVMAAQICRIPVISTTHGPLDVYREPFNRLFIQHLAGQSFGLSIYVSKILKSVMSPQTSMTAIVPNLINLETYTHKDTAKQPAWLLISRISAEKFASILRFVQAASDCDIPAIDIAGGGDASELRKHIQALNVTTQVNFLGEIKNIAEIIPRYLGVAGMGRVAI